MTKFNFDKRLFCPICRQYSMVNLSCRYWIEDYGPMTEIESSCGRCMTIMKLKTPCDISRAQYSGVQTKLDEYGGSE